MFWSSVGQGFFALTHWEVWVTLIVYMLAMFGVSMIGGLLVAVERPAIGMIWMLLFAPLLQMLATLVVVMTVAPIIFSLGPSAAWGMPWLLIQEHAWFTVKFIVVLVALLAIFGALGLGRFPSALQFIRGAAATAMTAMAIAASSRDLQPSDLQIWPGYLVVIGFLAVAGAMQLAVFALVGAGTTILRIDAEENESAILFFVMPAYGAAMFLPTFMYAAYLAPQLAAR